jgi:cation:H+ antiporter
MSVAIPLFVLGAVVSLATSWILVSRIERVGNRLGSSEALLGLVAGVAADAPEITAALTALALGEKAVGAGVIIGANVFQFAGLLGMSALIAGRIVVHRRVVVLTGVVASWVAALTLLTVVGVLPGAAGVVLAATVVVPYAVVLGVGPRGVRGLPLRGEWKGWLADALVEEEQELVEAINPSKGHLVDLGVAAGALVLVVCASITMERAAASIGRHYGIDALVLGALILGVVTSVPNAVAANYLAARGRGAAVLSTTLNGHVINALVGLLLPAAIVGLGHVEPRTTFVAWWYLGLTAVVLMIAFRDRGLRRGTGLLVIAGYAVFVGVVLATA